MLLKFSEMMKKEIMIVVSVMLLATFVKEIICREFELGPCYLQFSDNCSNNSIQFFLFSSESPDEAPMLLDKIKPKLNSEDLKKNFKLIIHGYGGNLDFNGSKQVRNAYLKKSNTMVIVVDWGRLAKLPCYPSAAINTKQAGECTAQFLMSLQRQNEGFKASRIHAIGFSLGAHVASFASNAVERMSGMKFDRITGLDPALPFFATARKLWKLDSKDAKFVDVLHTNAGFYGKMEACGHTDYYVNNGQFQPACLNAKNENTCSHLMAMDYFAESINSDVGFYGRRCESYLGFVFGWCDEHFKRNISEIKRIKMGEHCEKKPEGVVFVKTHRKSPYAMG